jgi:glycosyltransferase involved in cell wall biosynthesis
MATPKLTILLSGMIAGVPHQGGATWAVLQYLLGFKRLGHHVYFVEPVEEAALRPAGVPLARSESAAYFQRVMADFGMGQTSALLLAGTNRTVGVSYERLREIARRADVLVNISGLLADEALIEDIPLRAYLDLDPAFTQLWYAAEGIDMGFAAHTHFVTVGQAIGDPGCEVPTCGLEWISTAQPIVLEHWPTSRRIFRNALTTVANWRGYGSIEHEGIFYGQKVHSLREFFSLPTLTEESFLLALAIHPEESKDLVALQANCWRLVDPARVTHTPAGYQRFVRGSKAEFGIAKSGYVAARCGWFSDRSACYLAAGRPVIAQETGFSPFLPVGAGLFAFETIDDVLAAIEALNGDYDRHSRAARSIAEEYFDSDRVLGRLLGLLDVT